MGAVPCVYIGIMTQTMPGTKPLRVLIADDFSRVRRELATLLGLAGNIEIVGEAEDGKAAVTMAAALRPDVVLMDLEMPLMDGFQAAAEVKKHLPSCRVIALTVYSGQAERAQAASSGCDAFVVKGASLACLMDAICNSTKTNIEGGSK